MPKSMKATAEANPDIAFVKYMGKKPAHAPDDENLAENDSVSMALNGMVTTTTVHFSDEYAQDVVILNGEQEEGESGKIAKHLDRIRAAAGIALRAKVVSENSFPTGTGLSSSASGFAALTVAGAKAAGLELSYLQLSTLARSASGSACRCVFGGYVRWRAGDTSAESHAEQIFGPEHWDLADVVAVVNTARKQVSTTVTHGKVTESPYYAARLQSVRDKADACEEIIRRKDLPALGKLMEQEAFELHALFLTAGILHLHGAAVDLMKQVPQWRAEGLNVWFTVNTGQDVHLICGQKDAEAVKRKLESIGVQRVILNKPGNGARVVGTHLF